MDTFSHQERVFDTFSCPTTLDQQSTQQFVGGTSKQGKTSSTPERSFGLVGEKSHRTGDIRSSGARLLQPYLPCEETVGRLASGHRPVASQSLHSDSTFQDGDLGLRAYSTSERRLGNFHRSEGCVFSCTHPRQIETVSPFLFSRQMLPVSSSLLRPRLGSVCFHSDSQSCSSLQQASVGHSSSCVPRRLAATSSELSDMSKKFSLPSSVYPAARVYSQLGEIGSNSQAEICLSGIQVRPFTRFDRSIRGQNRQAPGNNSVPVTPGVCISQTTSFPVGSNGIYVSAFTTGQSSQAATAVVGEGPVVSERPVLGLQTASETVVPPCGSSVAEHSFSPFSSAITRPITRLSSVHGCEFNGMGSSFGRPVSFGQMVPLLGSTTHQCVGASRCQVSSESLSSFDRQQMCASGYGQHYCCRLSEQRRGVSVSDSFLYGNQDPGLVCETGNSGESPVFSRETQRSGGLSFQERSSYPHRVDSSFGSSVPDISLLGHSSHRPFRHQAEQATSTVRFASGGSTGLGSGCSFDNLGRHGGVCLSSTSNFGESSVENSNRDLSSHSDRSLLGVSTVVSQTSVTASGSSYSTSESSGSTDSAPVQAQTPQARIFSSSRLALLQRGLEEAGFSEKSATRICSAKRSSTCSLYNYRWDAWMDWCVGSQVDPINPTISAFADFLIFLFEIKNLSPSSIKGYRSAISSTLKHIAPVDIFNSPILTDIIRSMELEKPTPSHIVPQWDLSLVLRVLKEAPFEPLSSCKPRELTLKTVFLLALASGRRRSELHALLGSNDAVRFAPDASSVTLHFFPGFLAKNQIPSVASSPICIPALSTARGSRSDNTLCPVRALSFYFRRSKAWRRSRKRLFLSFLKGYDKEISASTISRWIVSTIKQAYEQSGESIQNSRVIKAHEIRALSNSYAFLNNTSLEYILKAGYWRSPSAFLKFYLRDTSGQASDLRALGPLVASQTIVSAGSSD